MTATATATAFSGAMELSAARVAATNAVADQFFTAHADAIAQTCHAMAERFQHSGRLLVAGDDAQRSDVAHVVVEFLHPVVVGKRALPAMALPDMRSGAAAQALLTLGASSDVLMLLSATALNESAHRLLNTARKQSMLTVVLSGGDPSAEMPSAMPAAMPAVQADHLFVVPSSDPCIVQETHELMYHVLWELVHVFFDHRAVTA